MSYSRHTIELTDVQALVVIDSLNTLIQAEDKNEDDKRIAQNIRMLIGNVIQLDKGEKDE